jgi:hypothetical protein
MANEKEVNDLAIPSFDTKNWTEEQVGFAPYWKPKKGEKIICRLVQKDEPEESFVRYLMQAGQDINCFRGGNQADDDVEENEDGEKQNNAEPVLVRKGEFFTVSVFYSLRGLFDFYLESGLKPWMEIQATDKVKTSKPGRRAWQWKLRVDPKDKKKADTLRAAIQAKQLAAKNSESEKNPELSS